MQILVACSSCSRQLRVPENLLGRLVQCPSCGNKFTATRAEEPPLPTINQHGEIVRDDPAPSPRAAIRREQDEVPRSTRPRRERDEEDDDRDRDYRRPRRDRDWDEDNRFRERRRDA